MSVMATTSSFTFSDPAFTSFFEPGVEFKYSATEDRELVEVQSSRWCFFLNSHYYHFQVPFDYLHFSQAKFSDFQVQSVDPALLSNFNGNNDEDHGDPGGPEEWEQT